MLLPEYVKNCIRALEAAGFAAYAVGGCVRDDLLGIPPHDYDLCTDALPQEIQRVFQDCRLVLNGVKHGTVKVLMGENEVEITTFRRDGDYLDSRHPDSVTFVPEIEADLARRDFTVNAIAWSPTRGYADPFGGREDLKNGILRAVGEPAARFREDALRILRGVRFTARFHFQAAPATLEAMYALAPLTDNLARERVLEELCGILVKTDAADLIRFAPILGRVIPELGAEIGFDQHSPHHAYDVFTHTAYVTQSVPPVLTLRWAALLHDIGKVPTFTQDPDGRGHFKGHAQVGAAMAEEVLRRLRAPNDLRERVVWLIDQHMTRLQPEEKQLRRALSRYGREALEQLLTLQEADMNSKGTDEHRDSDRFPSIRRMLDELEQSEGRMTLKSLAVTGNDLMAMGFTGKAIGICLNTLLDRVLDGTLENEKSALLNAAEAITPGR